MWNNFLNFITVWMEVLKKELGYVKILGCYKKNITNYKELKCIFQLL